MVVVSLSYGKSMPFCWAPDVDRDEVHWEWLRNNAISGSKFSDKKALTTVFLVVLPSWHCLECIVCCAALVF
eukprot:1515713-Lingulodinium_polyedra.AAC.1